MQFKSTEIALSEIIMRLIEKYRKLTELFFPKIPLNQIDDYLGDEMNFEIINVKFAKNRKIIAHATHDILFNNGDTLAIFLPLMGG